MRIFNQMPAKVVLTLLKAKALAIVCRNFFFFSDFLPLQQSFSRIRGEGDLRLTSLPAYVLNAREAITMSLQSPRSSAIIRNFFGCFATAVVELQIFTRDLLMMMAVISRLTFDEANVNC